MPLTTTKQFSFVSRALSERTFSVIRFQGVDGISRLYEFDITLGAKDPEIDLGQVLQNPATLTLHGPDRDVPVHGILARFEQLQEIDGRYLYHAVLVPRLWQADAAGLAIGAGAPVVLAASQWRHDRVELRPSYARRDNDRNGRQDCEPQARAAPP